MDEVKIIERHSLEVLFECSFTDMEKAYEEARKLEEMGLEVDLITPSVHETLGEALGISRYSKKQHYYNKSLKEEIDSH